VKKKPKNGEGRWTLSKCKKRGAVPHSNGPKGNEQQHKPNGGGNKGFERVATSKEKTHLHQHGGMRHRERRKKRHVGAGEEREEGKKKKKILIGQSTKVCRPEE